MNILFCGDQGAEDGVLIVTLSLLKNTSCPLHFYILTMYTQNYQPFNKTAADYLRSLLTAKNPHNSLQLIDCTRLFAQEPPTANMRTRFTPYSLLRLYADELDLPNRLLYLDDDVIIRRDCLPFYQQDINGLQIAGVLDYWGRFFFHNWRQKRVFDYLNSGVLLLNMTAIKRTALFKRVRLLMERKRMLLPDQGALNKLTRKKKIWPRRYNEQYRLQPDTVIQHFTTSFRFWPYLHLLTVKPWDIERMHSVLHLHEYDNLLNQYLRLRDNLRPKKVNKNNYSSFHLY